MKAVTAWILTILGIVLIGALVDLVLPAGRMNKFLKSLFATLTVCVIVLPLPGFLKNGFNFNADKLIQPDFAIDEKYLESAEKIKMSYLAKGLKKQLEEDGYKNLEIEIVGSFKDNNLVVSSVKINIANLVIDSGLSHINKYEQIEKSVTQYLDIDKGAVVIYE